MSSVVVCSIDAYSEWVGRCEHAGHLGRTCAHTVLL